MAFCNRNISGFINRYIMTQKQRDYGKVIAVAVMALIILIGMLAGCTPMLYKSNQIKVTHVLAVTEEGDTVKIAMKDIRPTQVYNVVGYDFTRGYMNPYYDPWRDHWRYSNQYRYYGNQFNTISSSANNNPYGKISNINPIISPSNISSGSNTTGGGGNPVASNPVTSTGGGKKNN